MFKKKEDELYEEYNEIIFNGYVLRLWIFFLLLDLFIIKIN